MVGFQNIEIIKGENEGLANLNASKAVINQGAPAKIKRKPKAEVQDKKEEESNPWANLETSNKDTKLINEDTLMKVETVVRKFCGEKDTMQKAKPCANCTCGLAEQVDGDQTVLVDG